MLVKLRSTLNSERGAIAFEDALLGTILLVGLVGTFGAIGSNLRGLITAIYTEESSFNIGNSYNQIDSPFQPLPYTTIGPTTSVVDTP